MKQKKQETGNILRFLYGLVLIAVLWLTLGSVESKAAETYIATGSNMASAPEIAIGESYYTTVNNSKGFVSFVTPPNGGYVTVYVINISIRGDNYPYLKIFT